MKIRIRYTGDQSEMSYSSLVLGEGIGIAVLVVATRAPVWHLLYVFKRQWKDVILTKHISPVAPKLTCWWKFRPNHYFRFSASSSSYLPRHSDSPKTEWRRQALHIRKRIYLPRKVLGIGHGVCSPAKFRHMVGPDGVIRMAAFHNPSRTPFSRYSHVSTLLKKFPQFRSTKFDPHMSIPLHDTAKNPRKLKL